MHLMEPPPQISVKQLERIARFNVCSCRSFDVFYVDDHDAYRLVALLDKPFSGLHTQGLPCTLGIYLMARPKAKHRNLQLESVVLYLLSGDWAACRHLYTPGYVACLGDIVSCELW